MNTLFFAFISDYTTRRIKIIEVDEDLTVLQ